MPSKITLDGDNFDVINSLLTGSPFKIRSDDDKLIILNKGRPVDNLNMIKKDRNKDWHKPFLQSWYNNYKWLCGSKSYNKLFCWPCLLMRPDTSYWCSVGTDDTNRFKSLAAKHETCKYHLKAVAEYEEMLCKFGLSSDLIDLKCKEESNFSDKNESDFSFEDSGQKSDAEMNCKVAESNKSDGGLNCKKITFKAWKELYRDNFPVSKSNALEDFKLYKWKRKIAKQELKNARLLGEKLRYDIQASRAKIEYYNALKLELPVNSKPGGNSIVPENQ